MVAHAKINETHRSQAMNLRVKPEDKRLIDNAARAQGKSRSEFMIEASRRAAMEAKLDNPHIVVSQEDYDWLVETLDRGLDPEAYRRLMETPAPWDR